MTSVEEAPPERAHALYAARRDARRTLHERLVARDRLLVHARLAIGVAGFLAGWLAFAEHLFSPAWLALPMLGFAAAVYFHHRTVEARLRAALAVAFYERGLARLEDRWAGGGSSGARFLDHGHPYAEDLDLFGEGSLFELLCGARTGAGEETLAAWLLAPAPPETIAERHEAVAELRAKVDLREELASPGEEVADLTDPAFLRAWGAEPPPAPSPALRVVAALFPVASIASLVAAPLTPLGVWLPLLVLAAQALFGRLQRDRVRGILEEARKPARDLALLAGLLERIGREVFGTSRLAALRARMETGGVAPHARLRRLRLWTDLLDTRLNPFFAPIGLLLLWTTQIAFAIGAWRARVAPALGDWLDAIGEFEALLSLAQHAYENPDDVFPDLAEPVVAPAADSSAERRPLLRAEGVGHVLLPRERCIRNDLTLDADHRVYLVSGSNMSGKSTLLRTIGTTAVLAQAGAPVRARALTLSPLQVGASIRSHDSIREGTSRFYAEITRIRAVVELARGGRPALFLLDEILQGTNSHDRRVGAAAVVRELVGAGAVGLITTHDLALTGIVEELAPRAFNVHFQDELVDGEMRFDYRLQEGVVARSNALELMRAIGLKV